MGWDFDFGIVLNQRIFIDPVVAIGYDCMVDAGSPRFASVLLPSFGNGLYDLLLWDGMDWVFDQALTAGVDRFRIAGIEPSANVYPNNPSAFVTGLTVATAGQVIMSMNPIRFDTGPTRVPAPGAFGPFAAAALAGVALRRTHRMA